MKKLLELWIQIKIWQNKTILIVLYNKLTRQNKRFKKVLGKSNIMK